MSLVRGLFGAITVLVLTAAVAAGGPVGDGPQTAGPSQLDAAATDAQTLAETSITALDVPTTTRSVVPRVTSTTTSTITASTVTSRTVESKAPATTRPTTPSAPATVTSVAPVKPMSPSSWTAQANGITVAARIEPAAPRAGDTVTISWTMTTAATRAFCCFSLVTVDGEFVGETGQSLVIPIPGQPLQPCPTGRVPSGLTTFVARESGLSTLTIRAHAMDKPCDFSYVDLSATFHVGPAGE